MGAIKFPDTYAQCSVDGALVGDPGGGESSKIPVTIGELRDYAKLARGCAAALRDPAESASLCALGRKFDAMASSRPVRGSGCCPRGC